MFIAACFNQVPGMQTSPHCRARQLALQSPPARQPALSDLPSMTLVSSSASAAELRGATSCRSVPPPAVLVSYKACGQAVMAA